MAEWLSGIFEWFMKGGPIMFPLLACSLVSVTITIERLLFWVRQGLAKDESLAARVIEVVNSGDIDMARRISESSKDRLVRIMHFALNNPVDVAEAAIRQAADLEIARMGRFLRILDTIVTIAPVLGILGTVVGIISSFDVLGTTGVDDPMAATKGIAHALLTTAIGMIILVITVIPYNYFMARADGAVNEMEAKLTHFSAVYGKGNSGK